MNKMSQLQYNIKRFTKDSDSLEYSEFLVDICYDLKPEYADLSMWFQEEWHYIEIEKHMYITSEEKEASRIRFDGDDQNDLPF